MLRIALTLYLVLATAAGPWVCCCAACPTPISPPPESPTPSAPHSCCCHEEAPPGNDANRELSFDHHLPAAPHGPCPCKAVLRDHSALAAAERAPGECRANPDTVTVGLLVTACCPDVCGQGAPSKEPIAFPFRAPRDMLRALHVLRC